MKRIGLVLLLCSAFFSTLCAGCSDVSTSIQKDTVLWVVTEASCSDGMNLQAEMIAERMEKEHPGLTVRLDILPTDPQKREITLKQLRTKIMAGNGPDVFLLPTGNTITTDYATANRHARGTTQTQLEPLFQDVVQAMRGGLFRDIQPFYLADATLDKQPLKTEVMEAGVINGRRYVLPLRFDIPIVYTDRELWDSRGLNMDSLDTGFQPMFDSLLDTADNAAGLFLPDDMSLLPEPFDYENEQVAVSVNRITDYLRIYQAWKSISPAAAQRLADAWAQNWMDIIDEKMRSLFEVQPELREKIYLVTLDIADFNDIENYICFDANWSAAGLPVYICSLAGSLESAAVAKLAQTVDGSMRSLEMYPLRTMDGNISASVTYYGAVGAGSENSELAYAFLRQFLCEEFQWDIYRPRSKKSILVSGTPSEPEVQVRGQVENSWPVRTVGSVPYLWDTVQYQVKGVAYSFREASSHISRQFQAMELTDADIPALSWDIDEVRFPVTISGTDSLEYALSQLNEPDGTPTDADIDALAQQVYQGLWWHLAGG